MKKNLQGLFAIIMAAIIILSNSCCRQANEFSFQKWERKYKFEKRKVSYVKYPGKRKTIIKY